MKTNSSQQRPNGNASVMMMSDERLRVHEFSRKELREMRRDGETYSDVLERILPDEVTEETVISDEGEMVVIPVSEEIHERVGELRGDGVTAGEVVDYYLFRQKVANTIAANELLDELYNRGS